MRPLSISANNQFKPGFTLVELLIVIVVIAVLATISIVAYNGIQDRAVDTVVKTDLSNAQKRLELYRIDLGWYPRADTEWTSEFRFTKDAYHTSVHNTLYCLNMTTDQFALVARSKSGSTYRLTQGGVEELGSVAVTPALACDPVGTTWGAATSSARHGYFEAGTEPGYTDGWANGWPWTE